MANFKNQHYVPQTYLKQWCANGEDLHIAEKSDLKKIETRKKDSVLFQSNKYTLYAGMLCNEISDLSFLFQPLENMVVTFNGVRLKTLKDLNLHFDSINDWKIVDSDGNIRSNKKLKNYISQQRRLRIEFGWYAQENDWSSTYQDISQYINNKKVSTVQAFKREELLIFASSLLFRGKNSLLSDVIMIFRDILDSNDEVKEMNEFFDQSGFWNQQELNQLSQYQKQVGGLFDAQKFLLENLQVGILVAPKNTKFITSDSPCYIIQDESSIAESRSGIYFPLSPHLCMFGGRNTQYDPKSKYIIKDISKTDVEDINRYTLNTSYEYIISEAADISIK